MFRRGMFKDAGLGRTLFYIFGYPWLVLSGIDILKTLDEPSYRPFLGIWRDERVCQCICHGIKDDPVRLMRELRYWSSRIRSASADFHYSDKPEKREELNTISCCGKKSGYDPEFHLKTTEERKALQRLATEPDKEVIGKSILRDPHLLKEAVDFYLQHGGSKETLSNDGISVADVVKK